MLGSGGFRTEERIRFLTTQMRTFFGTVDRLLFIPYALHDHDAYLNVMIERGINAGYVLDGIHHHEDPREAVRQAPAIFVGGGNTFRLLDSIYRFALLDLIRDRVRSGVPYLGISAGANIAGPTIKTTNDMPIVQPPSFDALGLVTFQINPHYYTGNSYLPTSTGYQQHFSETRDERIREFHEMNDTPVVGLWEAGILRIEGGLVHLLGTPARVFVKGQEPRDVPPDSFLDELMSP
jgi:dipeptidase E